MWGQRRRRIEEKTIRRHRQEVSNHYYTIIRAYKEVFPTLATFRRLPIVSLVQSQRSSTENGITMDLGSPFFAKLLEDDLRSWREAAREDMSAILGSPSWKSASSQMLHPLDRLTAWFQCRRCQKAGYRSHPKRCLTFTAACAHLCPPREKKRRAKLVWDPTQFVKDEKVCHFRLSLRGT
jgi:hypothetical protein